MSKNNDNFKLSKKNQKRRNQTRQRPTTSINLMDVVPTDALKTLDLVDSMKPYGVFESNKRDRMKVLGKITNVVKDWIKEMGVNKNLSPDITVGGKVFTFGSYRLGVHTNGGDIDALCVAPQHVDRTDFFTSFYELLKQQPEVSELRAIEEAFVPLIKLKFDEIELDLVFARLLSPEVPEYQDLRDSMLLKNLDPRCVRSLNGCRVADEILRLVPNKEHFRLALRAIKLWAKCSGIYSNVFGFLGGVSWTILVARTCQEHPHAKPYDLVHNFFQDFSRWEWPRPVFLKPHERSDLGFKVWDPSVTVADGYHLMPIITPSYPEQNSTFNVCRSTRHIIVTEIEKGLEITNDIIDGKENWAKLFETTNFFGRYRHFIVLIANAETKEDRLEFFGLVESKIRRLVHTLEGQNIKVVHAFPKRYEGGSAEKPSAMWFVGMLVDDIDKVKNKLMFEVQSFTDGVHWQTVGTNHFKEGMTVEGRYVPRRQLGHYLPNLLS